MSTRGKSLIVRLPVTSKSSRLPTSILESTITSAQSFARSESAANSLHITAHFSESQLAVALTVVKSKPEGLSMAEYLNHLRRQIKTGQPVPQDQLRYLDTAEFWKDQFLRVHAEKQKLQDENICLRESQQLARKRPSDDLEHDSVPCVPQEANGSDTDVSRFSEDLDAALRNDNCLRLNLYALKLRRCSIALENSPLDASNLDTINTRTEQLIDLLATLGMALDNCCLPLCDREDNKEHLRISSMLQQLTNQFALAFLACLNVTDSLCKTIPGRKRRSELVYRTVILFKQGLDVIQHNADNHNSNDSSFHHDHRPKRQRIEGGEYMVSKHLGNALSAIVHNAQWKIEQPAHVEILEGILSSILQHTGRLVSEAVFGEHVAGSSQPGHITERVGMQPGLLPNTGGRYIVRILYAAICAGKRRDLIDQMLAVRKTPEDASFNATKTGCVGSAPSPLSKARRLIQSTLANSILGGINLESLNLPPMPSHMPDVVIADAEKHRSDWLIHMVYSMVGWDNLCRQ